jgi:selenocysteine-specific elongation factor
MNAGHTIGVAGHVDHGKTTLVKALTGIDTDRKPEEKARGLSIEAGVAPLHLPGGRRVALIDVPGHSDFLKNAIRGLSGVDLAILVVAADDGVMPHTRQHLEILHFFKASAGVVVLTKADLVDDETLDLAELEVNELLAGTFLEGCPIFRFSAKRPAQGAQILQGLEDKLGRLPARQNHRPFRLWVDQVKSVAGHGTVVSGTIVSGRIRCHDEIEIQPAGTLSRARSLQTHAQSVSDAGSGQRVGINLHRVSLKDVRRGMSLGTPDAIRPVFMLNAEIRVLSTARNAIKNRQRVKIYLGTSVTRAVAVLMQGQQLEPGRTGFVQLRLADAVAALPGDPLVISPMNVNIVIAGGQVMETPKEKYRAAKSGVMLALLTALRKADTEAYVETLTDYRQGDTINARDLSMKTGLPQTAFERTINSKVQRGELFYIKGHGAVKKSYLADLRRQFRAVMESAFQKDPMKKKIGLPEIAEHLAHPTADPVLKVTAEALCRDGRIVRSDGGYRLADALPRRNAHHESQVAFLLAYVRQAGLTPVSPNSFWKLHRSRYNPSKVDRLFKYLLLENRLVRLNDNRFLSLDALEEIKRRVARAIHDKGFVSLKDSKALFGYGRSGGAHVLDYLNQIGFTERRGDRHFLAKTGELQIRCSHGLAAG